MKKNQNSTICFFVLFVLFTINANGQQIKKDGYSINGTIKGIDSGMVRMLSGNGYNVLDSSVIMKGKFSMQGKISTPERMLFNVSPGNLSFRAFVEDTSIVLSIDTTGAEHYGNEHDRWALIWEIDETGSEFSSIYSKYNKETNQKYYSLIFSSLRQKLKAAKGNEEAASKVKQEMDSVRNLVLARQKAWIENYINLYPSSIAGVYLFNEFYQSSPNVSFSYLDSILNRFSGLAQSSLYYKELANIAIKLKNTQGGSSAPDFTLQKRDKFTFTLSSTRGSYTLLYFWASWCVPCRKGIPAWKEVYAKYGHKGLVMVSVSDDRKWDDWIKALNKEQMPWVQVIDEFPDKTKPALAGELFGIKAFPFYVLIDKEGKVILSSNEEDIMRKKIEELFQ